MAEEQAMKPYRLLAFRFEVSRHETKALAIRAIDRRVKARTAAAGDNKPHPFDYEVRRNHRLVYSRSGYLWQPTNSGKV